LVIGKAPLGLPNRRGGSCQQTLPVWPMIRAGRCAGGLPGRADIGQKVMTGRGLFVENFVAPRAVVAHRRGRNEHRRPVVAWEGLETTEQILRADDAAVADPPLLGGRPAAFGNGIAGQVKDGVDASQGRGRSRFGHGVPGMHFGPAQPLASPWGVAGEHHRLGNLFDELLADEAGCSGDQGTHTMYSPGRLARERQQRRSLRGPLS